MQHSIYRICCSSLRISPHIMPKFLQTLQKEMISFLIPFPHSCTTVALKLFSLTLAKTRFISHINFIGRCLQAKGIPIGFRVKFVLLISVSIPLSIFLTFLQHVILFLALLCFPPFGPCAANLMLCLLL